VNFDLQIFSALVLLGISKSPITFTAEMMVKLDVPFAFDALVLSSTNVDLITFAVEMTSFTWYTYATWMFTCKIVKNGRREHSG
jgi:hypothetical protein